MAKTTPSILFLFTQTVILQVLQCYDTSNSLYRARKLYACKCRTGCLTRYLWRLSSPRSLNPTQKFPLIIKFPDIASKHQNNQWPHDSFSRQQLSLDSLRTRSGLLILLFAISIASPTIGRSPGLQVTSRHWQLNPVLPSPLWSTVKSHLDLSLGSLPGWLSAGLANRLPWYSGACYYLLRYRTKKIKNPRGWDPLMVKHANGLVISFWRWRGFMSFHINVCLGGRGILIWKTLSQRIWRLSKYCWARGLLSQHKGELYRGFSADQTCRVSFGAAFALSSYHWASVGSGW